MSYPGLLHPEHFTLIIILHLSIITERSEAGAEFVVKNLVSQLLTLII